MTGKSIEFDNMDAEGRLVLADALYYASTEFKMHTVIDVATLTGAMEVALGDIYTGVFTTSNAHALWDRLSYDHFWRMPIDEDYSTQIYLSNADLCNTSGKPTGSCTTALFLNVFVDSIEDKDEQEPSVRRAHLDIAATMEFTRSTPYQEKGMTGRRVHALAEFFKRLSSQE
ncbi:peptidase M17, leucyl aminopeptidase [Suillus subalutaceus]|uniref:peptidase M17, leucyl aminopeptidase n=1 Tax=Suillus subalutaceus TaxID=48586 RepID=UPI001B86508F|nr:peptidase M17, leucyl aminopeptidase [Suillus subalutaceus]KAG1842266.1 peptidase M17, leucyl aminopeptidase [Suillus subalutaceus]